MVNINTTPGDGGVRLGVDAFGTFGSAAGGEGTDNAFYDPIGTEDEAGTVFESYIAFRSTGDEARNFLNTVGTEANITESDETSVSSTFNVGNLSFQLKQSVTDLTADNARIGSVLNQEYVITNTGTETADFELIRYIDGDLDFDGSIQDTGGRRIRDGEEILFETDSGEDPSFATTFLGITAEGGSQESPGRFEIDSYSGLRNRILAGEELDEEITGDNVGNDGFVDTDPYDITLALRNGFSLEAGESATYTTETIFGTGTPGTVDISRSEEGFVELDTPIYRFQNTERPGTYLYVGEEERTDILTNYPNFSEEGYAFKVADEPGLGVFPIHRFHNKQVPGTYSFVGEDEKETILSEYGDTFEYEGIAFYTRGLNSNSGANLSRFHNSQYPGTYLYAGGGELFTIRLAHPQFQEEGEAFNVEI